jgi:hypothetical protein
LFNKASNFAEGKHILILYWKRAAGRSFNIWPLIVWMQLLLVLSSRALFFGPLKAPLSAGHPGARSQKAALGGREKFYTCTRAGIDFRPLLLPGTLGRSLSRIRTLKRAACFLFARSLRFFHPNSPKNQIHSQPFDLKRRIKNLTIALCERQDALFFLPLLVLSPIMLVRL